jgi:hypothetical protein
MYMWMCFVNYVLGLWICICELWYCVYCCELLIGAEKSVLGGNHQFSSASVVVDENMFPGYFRRPPPRPTKIAWRIFVGHQRPTKINGRLTIFVGLGKTDENRLFSSVPTKIAAYFRRTYFRRLFSSACRRKFSIFVGLGLFSWVFGPRKFRRFL